MDYSEFDALPSKTDEISISEEPSHAGIRDMPSLEKAGEIISARITEIGRTPAVHARPVAERHARLPGRQGGDLYLTVPFR